MRDLKIGIARRDLEEGESIIIEVSSIIIDGRKQIQVSSPDIEISPDGAKWLKGMFMLDGLKLNGVPIRIFREVK